MHDDLVIWLENNWSNLSGLISFLCFLKLNMLRVRILNSDCKAICKLVFWAYSAVVSINQPWQLCFEIVPQFCWLCPRECPLGLKETSLVLEAEAWFILVPFAHWGCYDAQERAWSRPQSWFMHSFNKHSWTLYWRLWKWTWHGLCLWGAYSLRGEVDI